MEHDRLAAQGAEDAIAAAHARDTREKQRIDMLRAVIGDFLDEPPARGSWPLREKLRAVLTDLDRAASAIGRA